MKTVMDAVNEFKGEFPLLRYTTDGWYEDGCDLTYREMTVCSEMDFSELLIKLETNFGESESYSNYKVNYEMINDDMKPVMDIDWSKAPEGATHHGIESGCYYGGFYKIISSDEGFFHDKSRWLKCQSWPELKERPQPKPSKATFINCTSDCDKSVFTQAMADKNELPPIDSEYLDEDNQLCKALFHFSSFVIGQMLDNPPIQQYPVFSTARNDRVSVIDTRTDKEKAIDDLDKLDYFHKLEGEEFINDVINGKIHGVEWVGE